MHLLLSEQTFFPLHLKCLISHFSPVAKGPLTGIFDGIDIGLNSRSFHQLLTALVAILIISAVVVS